MVTYQEYLLQFAKLITRGRNDIYFTLAPNYLYIHDKEKLHKSKIVWRFRIDESGLSYSLSDDGGETWKLCLDNRHFS